MQRQTKKWETMGPIANIKIKSSSIRDVLILRQAVLTLYSALPILFSKWEWLEIPDFQCFYLQLPTHGPQDPIKSTNSTTYFIMYYSLEFGANFKKWTNKEIYCPTVNEKGRYYR